MQMKVKTKAVIIYFSILICCLWTGYSSEVKYVNYRDGISRNLNREGIPKWRNTGSNYPPNDPNSGSSQCKVQFIIITNLATCSQFTDCFNCTSYMDIYSNCSWESGTCVNMGFGNLSSQNWWVYYQNCINYPPAKAEMEEYCGKGTYTIPATFSLQNIGHSYGASNLYCRWALNNTDPSKIVSFNFTSMTNDALSVLEIVVYYGSGEKDYNWGLDLGSFSWPLSKGMDSMEIHYFDSSTYDSNPFIISVDYTEDSTNYLSLIISIATIVFVCFICTILFYKCSRKLIEDARRRHELNAMGNQAENANPNASNINNNNNVSNAQDIEAERRKTNREILDKLLTTTLVPVVYSEKTNVYKNNCTICLEDFNLKSNVVVLECKHIFHFECLKDWLIKNILHPKCPNCNYDVVLGRVDEQHNHQQRPVNNINIVTNRVNVIQSNADRSHNNRFLNTSNYQPSSMVNININEIPQVITFEVRNNRNLHVDSQNDPNRID